MARQADPRIRAWSHFLGAHALAVRSIEGRLQEAGQPPIGWYDVLLELDRAGGRLRVGELSESVVIEPYNMTRLLDRLEKAGLLRRERAESDRRGTVACLTEKGSALRKDIWPHYQRAILDVFAPLTEAESESLVGMMKRVIARQRGEA